MIKAGRDAEEEARWHLDRNFGQSKNWKVFHDLTLPDHLSSSPCQIDHVMIGRLSDVIVLETKSAVNGMRLDPTTGAWTVMYQGRAKPMASPIEQNKRHIEVLAHYFTENGAYPRRLGITVKPKFHNWILVQPGVSLPPVYHGAWIVQRDQISRRFDEFTDKIAVTDLLRVMSFDELDGIGRFLESFKTPEYSRSAPVELAEVQEEGHESKCAPKPQVPPKKRGTFCEACGLDIEAKVAAFCRFNFARLGKKYLCRSCQVSNSR